MDKQAVKLVLAHPTGNQVFRGLAAALAHENQLATALTSINTRWLCNILTAAGIGQLSLVRELSRRSFSGPWASNLRGICPREYLRLLATRTGPANLTTHETGLLSIDSCYRHFDDAVANLLSSGRIVGSAIYCYEDAAEASFLAAKKIAMYTVYDLPIAHWETTRQILSSERERIPNWADTMAASALDSPEKLARKDRELTLANRIVVPSQFVRNSLVGHVDLERVTTIPFGAPEVLTQEVWNQVKLERAARANGRLPLRILFVGALTQRKGLADLFEAIRLLNSSKVELVVLGKPVLPIAFYRDQLSTFTYLSTRPNADVLKVMRSCDVFCLPSLVEGRATVVLEAMSQGLPVIITPNTGCDDLVQDGDCGQVIPPQSPQAIAQAIQIYLSDRDRAIRSGEMARERIRSETWVSAAHKLLELF